ncbi:MAG: ATP-binding cassette domain-containing protein, partial [Candidatus Binatia bacterium]
MATAEPDVLLAARDLSLHYGGASVLHGVQLEVSAGQFWFLLGANGEGKSTLLRAITGSLRPQAGSLTLHP